VENPCFALWKTFQFQSFLYVYRRVHNSSPIFMGANSGSAVPFISGYIYIYNNIFLDPITYPNSWG
jgi:hypothetical protein